MGARVMPYLRAFAATVAALLLRLSMVPVLGEKIPYTLFILIVAWSGLYNGLGPGILTALIGAAAAEFFLIPPYYRLSVVGTDDAFALGFYLIICCLILALTERQRRARARAEAAEAAERLQRQWLETTLGSIGDGVIATDGDARIVFINRVASKITGWSPADARGRALEEVFCIRNEETGAELESPVRRAMREGRIIGLANHTVLMTREGKRVPIDDSGAPIVSTAGKVIGAVMVFRDVTEAREREAEIRAREQMMNLSHDAILVADASRRIKSWNRGAEELYGWREAEARGKLMHELLGTRTTLPLSAIDDALRVHSRWDGELVHFSRDGRELVVESRQVMLRDAQGDIAGILEINRDITERKRAAGELKRSIAEAEEGRRTLHALLDYIPEGITIADAPDGRIRMVSRHGLELLAQPPEAVCDVTVAGHPAAFRICRPDGKTPVRPEELPLTRAIVEGKAVTGEEWAIRRPDGAVVPILCNAAPIRDAAGNITGALIAWRDLSQRKQIEEKLRETAKLESLGVLAGGIAHDFNNLLTGILGNADLLMETIPHESPSFPFVDGIFKAAERAADLTQQMLAYSGRGRFVIQPVDLSAYIRETITLIEASIPKNVEMRLDLARDLPPVEADTAQLQQLVMNLVVNGAEAIGEGGGRLHITTRLQTVDEVYIGMLRLAENLEPGSYVVLDVRDTGCGMDEATVARIFEPFFTTKFAGRGLGLAAVQGIVRGHKGAIKVYSEPGKGTTFRVLLPADTAAQPQFAEEQIAVPAHTGAGTVLLVDDEPIVRRTGKAALEHLGYEVIVAENGRSAVEIFRANPDGIRLIVLDMTMPGISGEEAMREFREIDAGVPILLSSGFSEIEALSRFGGYRLAGFLQKPFTVAALAEKVKAATAE